MFFYHKLLYSFRKLNIKIYSIKEVKKFSSQCECSLDLILIKLKINIKVYFNKLNQFILVIIKKINYSMI